ncbi:MAG: hypothetical protein AVO35_13260 [Candidatus Aegiribacteria sp. MLS_C]|nr:MAG: hypothetical protein AVO35_13260 [Candidatus Aegiribacteria sp. MLS_C]
MGKRLIVHKDSITDNENPWGKQDKKRAFRNGPLRPERKPGHTLAPGTEAKERQATSGPGIYGGKQFPQICGKGSIPVTGSGRFAGRGCPCWGLSLGGLSLGVCLLGLPAWVKPESTPFMGSLRIR